MRCWNCGKKIPNDAKVCGYCEVAVDEAPTDEETEIVGEILSQMGPEAMEELQAAFEQSSSADEFANLIMVGECPKCGSTQTADCENDPEIDDILVGRCFACGQLWCTECRKLLERASAHCECWEQDDDEFDDMDEFDDDDFDDEDFDDEDLDDEEDSPAKD